MVPSKDGPNLDLGTNRCLRFWFLCLCFQRGQLCNRLTSKKLVPAIYRCTSSSLQRPWNHSLHHIRSQFNGATKQKQNPVWSHFLSASADAGGGAGRAGLIQWWVVWWWEKTSGAWGPENIIFSGLPCTLPNSQQQDGYVTLSLSLSLHAACPTTVTFPKKKMQPTHMTRRDEDWHQ